MPHFQLLVSQHRFTSGLCQQGTKVEYFGFRKVYQYVESKVKTEKSSNGWIRCYGNQQNDFILSTCRITAEEAYIHALVKITKNSYTTDNQTNIASTMDQTYFGNYTTTFQVTTNQYEVSIERTIDLRREFISSLKGQMELLIKVKVCV